MTSGPTSLYDLVSVGFGPAAIAVAAAIDDSCRAGSLPKDLRGTVVFLERQQVTKWQGGLLLPSTNINHSSLRDLATPRDPASRFTFAQYLKQKGRIYEHGAWTGAVSRIEWSEYVSWAATQLAPYVSYGEAVETITLDPDGVLAVVTARASYRARRVMLACGMEPHLPPILHGLPEERVQHADSYLYYRNDLDRRIQAARKRPLRVAIIGSGLSAAEIMHDLLARHDPEQIVLTSIHRGLPFRQYDMSQFSNQIYMPPEVDRFSVTSAEQRRELFTKTWATNFSGVDAECSAQEYNFLYERRIMGINNFILIDRHEIVEAQEQRGDITIRLKDIMGRSPAKQYVFDFVIAATGYVDTIPERLMRPISAEIEREFDGRLSIDREYRLRTSEKVATPIFLNGHCEHTHGIADTQSFSLIAFKAERLVQTMFSQAAKLGANVSNNTDDCTIEAA